MPVPFFNVLNGGVHSGNTMVFQEFMIAPTGATSMAHAVQIGSEVYQELSTVIKEKFGSAGDYHEIRMRSEGLVFGLTYEQRLGLETKEDLHLLLRRLARRWTC